jgi:mannose-6-phosphate isomerase-like protein (cupin superfamily)
LNEYASLHPETGEEFSGKIFLGDKLKLSGMEVSFQISSPGMGLPFFRKHRENEDFYIILKGCGEFHVDNDVLPVREGSVIRVATSGARSWNNTSDSDMIVMTIQAVEGTLKGYDTSDGYMDS